MMKKNKFLCIGLLPTLLCSFVLLLITFFMEIRDIEALVKKSAKNALSNDQLSWATIETYNRGRGVLITGSPPSIKALEKVINTIQLAPGVHSAVHNGQAVKKIITVIPPTLTINIDDLKLTLSGTLASESDKNAVLNITKEAFRDHSIDHSLSVKENVAPLDNLHFISALTPLSLGPKQIKAELKNNRFQLSGSTSQANTAQQIESKLRQSFNGKISNNIKFDSAYCQRFIDAALKNKQITFDLGKASISPVSLPLLDTIINAINRCPTVNYEISGHTDNSGNQALNLILSQKRAQTVANELSARGINPERLSAKGYGSSLPIAENNSVDGKAKNRRIEFKIIN